jgi:hypothetical protein
MAFRVSRIGEIRRTAAVKAPDFTYLQEIEHGVL